MNKINGCIVFKHLIYLWIYARMYNQVSKCHIKHVKPCLV